MARLLVVHHTTSPRLQALLEAVLSGARDETIQDVTVLARPALVATAIDVLGADGYLLGTPANLGYMSGALKHFLDQIYYPCLEATVRRPYGLYVHGDSDTTGAVRAVEAITRGLGWRRAQAPVAVLGDPSREDLQACWELGAAMAAGLTLSAGRPGPTRSRRCYRKPAYHASAEAPQSLRGLGRPPAAVPAGPCRCRQRSSMLPAAVGPGHSGLCRSADQRCSRTSRRVSGYR